jgi:3-oxoacyl-[acyl-carrier protein] reductase
MDAMPKLDNQSALVTGASRGIGRAIAVALATEGARIVLTARSEDDLKETAALCEKAGAAGTDVRPLDLSDGAAIDALCEALLREHGRVDVLVNNAGTLVRGHALSGEPETWEMALKLNVAAPMRLTRRLAPAMEKNERGTIINLGSVAAIEGMTDSGAYAATKHALRGWSLSCYQKLRRSGIKVVLINPAFVNTAMTAHVEDADRSRMLSPEDIAEAAMLAVRTSPACCPEEITLRLTKPPLG